VAAANKQAVGGALLGTALGAGLGGIRSAGPIRVLRGLA
jgi:hypothetical protein